MTSRRWMLVVCCSLIAVLRSSDSAVTKNLQKYTCGTFGSGVVSPFQGIDFYLRTTCPVTLAHFTHKRVECDIVARRGADGLLLEVEIIINKVRTVLRNGSVLVEDMSVSLPYDHTYQHIYQYGVYTRLRSLLLPLTVTWHSVPGGMDSLWVVLDQDLSADMTGLCIAAMNSVMFSDSVRTGSTCQSLDSLSSPRRECRSFQSEAFECLRANLTHYTQLCEQNIYKLENPDVHCSFFREVVRKCDKDDRLQRRWRDITRCDEPTCPGNMSYLEGCAPFGPSCSHPDPRASDWELTDACVCPQGTVLNDRAPGSHCVPVSRCPCVYAGMTFAPGDARRSKCQSCLCENGRWLCSDNDCPPRCLIEGTYVTTYDGKQYTIPGKCEYLASQMQVHNWSVSIQFFSEGTILKSVVLEIFQDKYVFLNNVVLHGSMEITQLHQSAHALIFWQSSTYVQVSTSVGMTMQVQMSPHIQVYITLPMNHGGALSGLCGNSNSDTSDDFTTSSGIIESAAQIFAESWSIGRCGHMVEPCVNTDYEMFADDKCAVLKAAKGKFAKCHDHVMVQPYHEACVQRVCTCTTSVSSLQQCLCVALGSYAKACANVGVQVGDWRTATDCDQKCEQNQQFSYDIRACNHTCLSMEGPDPRCEVSDCPVDGCGCPDGTHKNKGGLCTSMAECMCYYQGHSFPPGPVNMNGKVCTCEDGKMECSYDCGCTNGTICVDCAQGPMATAQKTCDSLSKPMSHNMTCETGCYCPPGEYEDHHGKCVSMDNCTCMYSGSIYSSGEMVKSRCKTCTCDRGHWHCKHKPCSDTCLVFGNGHYRTFDAKWFSFDGHCQYTLVEDDCGTGNGSFSITVESVPCCDENHTCSRNIEIELQGIVTLTLNDMSVTKHLHKASYMPEEMHYTVTSVGLYIIISVRHIGMTIIWDKSTMVTIELQDKWRRRVCGLCGNFDSNEMNDLHKRGSMAMSSTRAFGNSWKTGMPPCSDVTTETFPCERKSYCMAWVERRCAILTGDIFKACHLKVDPVPYYMACVMESCSCQFDGKFQGFCTAVAAYAEACSDHNICINWRTPDMCPVYCDYYNHQSQCIWQYEACGEVRICGIAKQFNRKLEGCFPKCPEYAPYYDENTGKCTELVNCTCYSNDTVFQPGTQMMTYCFCVNGSVWCDPRSQSSTTTQTSATTVASTTFTTTMPTTTWTSMAPTTMTTVGTTVPTTTWTSMAPTTMTTVGTTEPTTTWTSMAPTTMTTVGTTEPTTTWTSMAPTTMTTVVTTEPTTTWTSMAPTTMTTVGTTEPTTTWTSMAPTTMTTVGTTEPTTTWTSMAPTTMTTVVTTEPTTTWTSMAPTTMTTVGTTMLTTDWGSMTTTTSSSTPSSTTECPKVCPQTPRPICPHKHKPVLVWEGCCETWVCDCECEVYGDPHYVTFEGVFFSFFEECTYILMEEKSPRHHLTIAVDNFDCGGLGSCARGFVLNYQNNTASLRVTQGNVIQATLNHEIIQLPYEQHGMRFETGDPVVIRLPELRSYVSLTQFNTLKVVLAWEHFFNNTQGQCGVCGGPSCIRRDGQVEDDDCCDKTAYDWVYPDPMKPACASAPVNVSCDSLTTPPPTHCVKSTLCLLLDDEIFDECRQHVDLERIKKNCVFDSCGRPDAGCSSLEFAYQQCQEDGFCIEWRKLTNGTCDVQCPNELVYSECRDKQDDVCYDGAISPGMPFVKNISGCFCPMGLIRSEYDVDTCVSNCTYNDTCSHNGTTYEVGARWRGRDPCMTFICTSEGVQIQAKSCACVSCPEEDRVWDDDHCCHSCMATCSPKMTNLNVTLIRRNFQCNTSITIPVCRGPCAPEMRAVLNGDLQVEQVWRCCQKVSSERRYQIVQCTDFTSHSFFYDHITSCECLPCS